MKIAYPDGFEEFANGSILKETLKALEYLHEHGHIHRDVKVGQFIIVVISSCIFHSLIFFLVLFESPRVARL